MYPTIVSHTRTYVEQTEKEEGNRETLSQTTDPDSAALLAIPAYDKGSRHSEFEAERNFELAGQRAGRCTGSGAGNAAGSGERERVCVYVCILSYPAPGITRNHTH